MRFCDINQVFYVFLFLFASAYAAGALFLAIKCVFEVQIKFFICRRFFLGGQNAFLVYKSSFLCFFVFVRQCVRRRRFVFRVQIKFFL